jgi:hypothetical protein
MFPLGPKAPVDQAITGIDCRGMNISAVEFTFVAKDVPDGPYGFACEDNEARIRGIRRHRHPRGCLCL